MALETATYISDLNAANPAATDGLAQADDHFRIIKGAVKATFPNVTGAISATHVALDAAATFAGAITASVASINNLSNITATADQLNSTSLIGTLPVVGTLAQGSVVVGNSSSVATAVTLGTSGTVLTSDGTDAAWTALPAVSNFDAGMVQMFANTTVPTGWLECDGTAVSRTTYATLFAAIGTAYGVGNGSSTFTLPDMRGEFPRGWDNSRGIDSGRGIGTSQDDQMEQHNHIDSDRPLHTGFGYGTGAFTVRSPADTQHGNVSTVFGNRGGTSNSNENRPRNVALMFCIKV
jgi:microcystin-dependent protein